jgi:hypothetical protein
MSLADIQRLAGKSQYSSVNRLSFLNNFPNTSGLSSGGPNFSLTDLGLLTAWKASIFSPIPAIRSSEIGEFSPNRHPALGAMKGMVKIAEGYDLTLPTGELWDLSAEDELT